MPESALNLRLALAAFGLVVCVALGVVALQVFGIVPSIVFFVLAAVALVDLVLVQRRRATRARTHRRADHRHDSLFE